MLDVPHDLADNEAPGPAQSVKRTHFDGQKTVVVLILRAQFSYIDTPKMNPEAEVVPHVFISASDEDFDWVDRLRDSVEHQKGGVNWWHHTGFKTGTISWTESVELAIGRTVVAVVLLSPSYVNSDAAQAEFARLAKKARDGKLKLVPIIVRKCEWWNLQIEEAQIFGSRTPLGELHERGVEIELEKISKYIVDLVHKAAFGRIEKKELPLSKFLFSQTAEVVLNRAISLAKESNRAAVTSSCMLFAFAESSQIETSRFVRDMLKRTGKYEAALAAFMRDSGGAAGQVVSDVGGILGPISENVRMMLESAKGISERVHGQSAEIHQRDLVAAMLVAPQRGGTSSARRRLEEMGISLPDFCREFGRFIHDHVAGDSLEEWDAVLDVGTIRDAEQKANDNEVPSGPAGYTCEFCGVGGDKPVLDYLDVSEWANRLAELIALRETKLPLAIGLFGNWGSGKSHFMNLMDRHLKKLASEAAADSVAKREADSLHDSSKESSWCREIVPIYFNAWHYADTNLWASFITEIFEGLFDHLQPKQDELALVHSQLRQAGGATARAEEEALRARQAVQVASAALKEARIHSESARQAVQGLFDNLRTLLPQVNTPENRQIIFTWLGVSAEVATLSQLVAKDKEIATLPGRVRELWRRIVSPGGRWWRLGWLVGLLFVGPFAVRIGAQNIPGLKDWCGHIGPVLQRGIGWVLAFLAWCAPTWVQIRRGLGQMERWQRQAETAQAAQPKNQNVIDAQNNVIQAEAAAAAAEARLAVAQAQEQEFTQAGDHLRPERRLHRFIEARARSADYRGQLGLISLARCDFQELSEIFTDKEALTRKLKDLSPEKGEELKKLGASIDRIVLFVDDLDRCQPDKVVEVLQAVHLLLAFPLFAVVVGVDQRCLKQSVERQFTGLVSKDNERHDVEHPATALDYLEKVFHVPFHLPQMDQKAFGTLISSLTDTPLDSIRPDLGESVPRDSDMDGGTAPATEATGSLTLRPTVDKAPSLVTATRTAISARVIGSVPLFPWERNALKDYYPLIRTPRGVIRLLNTYRLVRAGIPAEEWDIFRGDGSMRGEFRIVMLLLALAAGYPAVARDWFAALRTADATALFMDDSECCGKNGLAQFKRVYDATFEQTTPQPTKELFTKWLDRVERFAF